jgi:hypothetical protein
MTPAAAEDTAPTGRSPRPFVVFAFGSTHESLAAESALEDAGFEIRVVPLPRHRGSLCGIAVRISPKDEHEALVELAKHDLTVAARDEIEDI